MLTVARLGVSQALRLASNLMLAKLLFPEAFGIMAIVNVVIQGLMQFSSVGVSPAIMQSPRGDEPVFLDTACTVRAARGLLLFLTACPLAWPLAQILEEPLLTQILPMAGLARLIAGLNPMALDTAKRHLRWGRLTSVEFALQIAGLVLGIALACGRRLCCTNLLMAEVPLSPGRVIPQLP